MYRVQLSETPVEGVTHDPDISKQVMIGSGVVPGLTNFSRAVLVPGQAAAAHAHVDMYELYLVESGHGVMRVDGTEVDLTAGTCLVIEPGEMHELINAGNEDLAVIYFGIAPA